jgi:FtsH-binding integral membrane protein
MNQYDATNVATGATTDLGLKSFMLGTYRYMMMAMGVTAVVAYFFGQYMVANPAIAGLVFSPFVLLGFVIAIPVLFGTVGAKLPSMSKGGVLAFLFGFSAFMGVFLSAVSFAYDPTIIAKIFFMTVALFGALSMFGYTTKTDLMPYLKFAAIGFLIYVVYMVASSFFPAIAPTGTLQMVVQGVALVLISVIAASKTQMLKRTYYSAAGNTAMLLLTFINMFQILLSLFGRE